MRVNAQKWSVFFPWKVYAQKQAKLKILQSEYKTQSNFQIMEFSFSVMKTIYYTKQRLRAVEILVRDSHAQRVLATGFSDWATLTNSYIESKLEFVEKWCFSIQSTFFELWKTTVIERQQEALAIESMTEWKLSRMLHAWLLFSKAKAHSKHMKQAANYVNSRTVLIKCFKSLKTHYLHSLQQDTLRFIINKFAIG